MQLKPYAFACCPVEAAHQSLLSAMHSRETVFDPSDVISTGLAWTSPATTTQRSSEYQSTVAMGSISNQFAQNRQRFFKLTGADHIVSL